MARALPSVALLAGIGIAGGFFGALFGVGGGIIVVPLLIAAAGFGPREAAGTSLAVIGFTAVFGMLAFAALGEVHWRDAALVGAPAALGTLCGHLASAAGLVAVPRPRLRRVHRRRRDPAAARVTEIALALVLGLGAGVLSGLFGVGGGILFVPTLVLVVGLTQLEAQATSLAAIIPVVAVGAWRQSGYGNVNARAALIAGLASGVGVAAGAVLADSLSDSVLRTLFAVLLLLTAARLAYTSLRG